MVVFYLRWDADNSCKIALLNYVLLIKHTLLKKLLFSTSIKREEIVKIRIPALRVEAGNDSAVV